MNGNSNWNEDVDALRCEVGRLQSLTRKVLHYIPALVRWKDLPLEKRALLKSDSFRALRFATLPENQRLIQQCIDGLPVHERPNRLPEPSSLAVQIAALGDVLSLSWDMGVPLLEKVVLSVLDAFDCLDDFDRQDFSCKMTFQIPKSCFRLQLSPWQIDFVISSKPKPGFSFNATKMEI